jgi:NAD(P) transhydrogenase subunit alpha
VHVGIPTETAEGERRVALVPETIGRLGDGVEAIVEPGAGVAAGFSDDAYREAGATIGDSQVRAELLRLGLEPVQSVALIHI